MLNTAAFLAGLGFVLVLVAGIPATPMARLAFVLAVALVGWVVWRVRAMDREAAILRRVLPQASRALPGLANRLRGIGVLLSRMSGHRGKGEPSLVHFRAGSGDRIKRAATALDAAWVGVLVPTREDEDGFEAHVMSEGDDQAGNPGQAGKAGKSRAAPVRPRDPASRGLGDQLA